MASDKKIIWKKSGKRKKSSTTMNKKSDIRNSEDLKDILSVDEMLDIAQRSGDHSSHKKDVFKEEFEKEENIADIKSEIDALFGGEVTSSQKMNTSSELNVKERGQAKKPDVNLNGNSLKDKLPLGDTKSIAFDSRVQNGVTHEISSVNNKPFSEKQIASEKPERKESERGSASTLAALKVIQDKKEKEFQEEEIKKNLPQEEEKDVVDNLKKSIEDDLRAPLLQENSAEQDDVAIARLLEKKEKAKGVSKTYYSDLSGAMTSNNPRTMSELLERSRREEKMKSISSPFSKKNILYILGSVLLFVAIAGIIFYLWSHKKEKEVKFITEKRVPSLVYADSDVGINATIAETVKTKQAIRKVIEEELPDEDLKQIYYVGKDSLGNLRRLGIKQVFESTDNVPPKLLYENIENNFMHGVYRTDKNEPFMILKVLSYDRAFKGMKEWEPTMIDDLSSYLDLPKEAGDRSLLEPGFSDDLINNKNVRVARFLPREVDRRNGVFDVFKRKKKSRKSFEDKKKTSIENSKNQEANVQEVGVEERQDSLLEKTASLFRSLVLNTAYKSFAQEQNNRVEVIDATAVNEYRESITPDRIKHKNEKGKMNIFSDKLNKGKIRMLPKKGDSVGDIKDLEKILQKNKQATQPNTSIQFGTQGGGSTNITTSIVQTSGSIIHTNGALDAVQKKACFSGKTGNRILEKDVTPMDFCFYTRQCWPYVCVRNNIIISETKEENLKNRDLPGVRCGVLGQEPIPYENIDTYKGHQVCTYYHELLNLKNIRNKNICFDQYSGQYIEGIKRDSFGGLPEGVYCLNPLYERATMCVTNDNRLVFEGVQPKAGYKFCFESEGNRAGFIGDQFYQNYGLLQQQSTIIALELKALSLGLGLFGVDGAAETLEKSSDFFLEISYGNINENQAKKQALGVASQLDRLLERIDPQNQLSFNAQGGLTVIGRLRNVIELIKQSFGYKHNLAWITLGNGFPDGFALPGGVAIRAGEELPIIKPVQQMFVKLGLMKEISITGKLDLVTQDALNFFQKRNGLPQSGILDKKTMDLIKNIFDGKGKFFGDKDAATIDNYLKQPENDDSDSGLGFGSYGQDVQSLKIFLYAEGYEVDELDGVFDEQLCSQVRAYQKDNDLELADTNNCSISPETITTINASIKKNNYLGSGFVLKQGGVIQGTGVFLGTTGPGSLIDFSTKEADADTLREGDLVLLYTFLDEKTLLIARNESVMDEIIKRRAFHDIFEK